MTRPRPAGHEACSFSTGIDGSVTAGRGKLDDNGFWEHPCPSCADRMALSLAHERITALEADLAAARDEAAKWRTAASVLCGEHVGKPLSTCPVCAFIRKSQAFDRLYQAGTGVRAAIGWARAAGLDRALDAFDTAADESLDEVARG